jgi:hypothetical protein
VGSEIFREESAVEINRRIVILREGTLQIEGSEIPLVLIADTIDSSLISVPTDDEYIESSAELVSLQSSDAKNATTPSIGDAYSTSSSDCVTAGSADQASGGAANGTTKRPRNRSLHRRSKSSNDGTSPSRSVDDNDDDAEQRADSQKQQQQQQQQQQLHSSAPIGLAQQGQSMSVGSLPRPRSSLFVQIVNQASAVEIVKSLKKYASHQYTRCERTDWLTYSLTCVPTDS